MQVQRVSPMGPPWVGGDRASPFAKELAVKRLYGEGESTNSRFLVSRAMRSACARPYTGAPSQAVAPRKRSRASRDSDPPSSVAPRPRSRHRGHVRRLDCRVELHRITALLARAVTGTLAA